MLVRWTMNETLPFPSFSILFLSVENSDKVPPNWYTKGTEPSNTNFRLQISDISRQFWRKPPALSSFTAPGVWLGSRPESTLSCRQTWRPGRPWRNQLSFSYILSRSIKQCQACPKKFPTATCRAMLNSARRRLKPPDKPPVPQPWLGMAGMAGANWMPESPGSAHVKDPGSELKPPWFSELKRTRHMSCYLLAVHLQECWYCRSVRIYLSYLYISSYYVNVDLVWGIYGIQAASATWENAGNCVARCCHGLKDWPGNVLLSLQQCMPVWVLMQHNAVKPCLISSYFLLRTPAPLSSNYNLYDI